MNNLALKMIADGTTNVSDISKATGLSDGQVRYRFREELRNAKSKIKQVVKTKQVLTEPESIFNILKSIQKDINEIKKDVKNLKKLLSDKWFDNPFLSGSWGKEYNHHPHEPFDRFEPSSFRRVFTGDIPENCLVEVEYLSGKRKADIAISVDWSIRSEIMMVTTVSHGEVTYVEYDKNPRKFDIGIQPLGDLIYNQLKDKADYVTKYRIIQAGK